jgi:hypothetical protein
MSNDKRNERSLDSALNGDAGDDETRPLVDTADRVKQALAVDVPPADRQRALFLSGVAARDRRFFSPARVLVPAFAIALIVFAAFAGQNALPGQGLYPVREALNSVGIGDTPGAEIDDHLFQVAKLLRDAEEVVDTNPARARNLAVESLERLGAARELLPELDGERLENEIDRIEDFEDDAVDILVEASEEADEALEDAREDDNSGTGSDDSSGSGSGSDDNSGSGSDDSGSNDNSGSGSDDSGSDDNSGSGSDDSGSDDSSGSGSDDSSGSGSGSDDSGSSGSSGSGSGEND